MRKVREGEERRIANLSGYTAIILWSFSALFIGWSPQIPLFLMAALTSLVGFSVFGLSWMAKPQKLAAVLRQNWRVWGLYFLSIVVYRAFYLAGLKLAPIVEGNLVNYLWPILIVLGSSILYQERMSIRILAGAVFSFFGVLTMGQHDGGGFSFAPGHVFAFLGAMTWAVYSLLTRRWPLASTESMGIMHLMAALFFGLLHKIFETEVDWNSVSEMGWIGVAGWGLSLSIAYKLWDRAMSVGDRDVIAVAAYGTPLLSTLWLTVLNGAHSMEGKSIMALILILGGLCLAQSGKLVDKHEKRPCRDQCRFCSRPCRNAGIASRADVLPIKGNKASNNGIKSLKIKNKLINEPLFW